MTARCGDGPWLPSIVLVRAVMPDGSFDVGRLQAGRWQFRVTHPSVGTVTSTREIAGTAPVTVVVDG